MGYSCTQDASHVLHALLESQQRVEGLGIASWKYKGLEYFFERGRENSDGAITGTVYRMSPRPMMYGKGLAYKAGTARIDANGAIIRFPGTDRKKWAEAVNRGLSHGYRPGLQSAI